MTESLRASPTGLQRVDRIRRRKQWNKTAETWCHRAYTSKATLKRFWAGQPIRKDAFIAICDVIEVDWQTVAQETDNEGLRADEVQGDGGIPSGPNTVQAVLQDSIPDQANTNPAISQQDWGDAPELPQFCGRTEEQDILTRWFIQDRCRLIALLGMGGIGKTAIASHLAQQFAGQFERIIWRSLRNAPPINQLLAELIQFLSDQQETTLPDSLDGKILRLMQPLKTRRCLMVLDNLESILQERDRMGQYRVGYEGYGQLLQCIGEIAHQSCLLITSREKPTGLSQLEGTALPVRSLYLKGLSVAEGRVVFQLKGTFAGTDQEWQSLIHRYAGNPLALKIVASSIQDCFEGNLIYFLEVLKQGPFILDDIRHLLDQQFERLTALEQEIMYWLAINREPTTFRDLQTDLVNTILPSELLESLASLQRRALIERHSETSNKRQYERWTQQPVVMEYVIRRFIEQVSAELQRQQIRLFSSHALIKAQCNQYVRETQISLILRPVLDRLQRQLGSTQSIVNMLRQILEHIKTASAPEASYAGGNILNLLRHLHINVTGYDFSNISIWQADLQGMALHRVNFAGADLSRSSFTEILGNTLAAAFSPNGECLATCDTDGKVRLWSAHTGKLQQICSGHTNWVRCIAFSPDGKHLASGSADQTVKLWDLTTGECITTHTIHHDEVHTIAFSPDGQYLVSGSADRTICIWHLASNTTHAICQAHTHWVRSVAFSPNGKWIASGSADRTIKVWDVSTGACLATCVGHTDWVRSIAFAPQSIEADSAVLASASSDHTIKIWTITQPYPDMDRLTFLEVRCIQTYQGHSRDVYTVAFAADGSTLASGSGDKTVRVWNLDTGQCCKTLHGQTNQVLSVTFSPDGQSLAAVSLDQTIRLWDWRSGQCLRCLEGHTDWAFPVAFSPKGQVLVSGSGDQAVHLWDIQHRIRLKTLTGHTDQVFAVAINPKGSHCASGSTDQTIRIWNLNQPGDPTILSGHTDWVRSVAFSPAGEWLASGSADGTIKLWDWEIAECLTTFQGHENQVYGVAFSQDTHYLASASTDQTIRLWNVQTGNCQQILRGHERGVYAIAISPEGNCIASGSADCTIRIWHLHTGQCLRVLTGHRNWVFSVAFSPDGQYLASSSVDRTIRIWQVKTGQCLRRLVGHRHQVCAIAFSPDGHILASGSQDQTIRLWNLETGECLACLISERLYEGMIIANSKGLSAAQTKTLKALGAIDTY